MPGAAAQIPVTGLLLVGLGQGTGQAEGRVLDTLIGAVVAVAVNFIVLPPNHVTAARRAADVPAQQIVDVLSAMAAGIGGPWTLEEASGWLRQARSGRELTANAESSTETATDSLRLHPGRSTWTGPLERIQRAVDTLRTVEVQTRVLARTLRDTAGRHPTDSGRQPPLPMADDLLTATAGAVTAFSRSLIIADGAEPAIDDAARTSLAQARARTAAIEADLEDMLEANLSRGIHLATLVVETGRILDELAAGLLPPAHR